MLLELDLNMKKKSEKTSLLTLSAALPKVIYYYFHPSISEDGRINAECGFPYQNLRGKGPEWRHGELVWIPELHLQQQVTQRLHAAAQHKQFVIRMPWKPQQDVCVHLSSRFYSQFQKLRPQLVLQPAGPSRLTAQTLPGLLEEGPDKVYELHAAERELVAVLFLCEREGQLGQLVQHGGQGHAQRGGLPAAQTQQHCRDAQTELACSTDTFQEHQKQRSPFWRGFSSRWRLSAVV